MAISEFCHRDVVWATRETTVTDLANLMRQHHIGEVIIVETHDGKRMPVVGPDGALAGIITLDDMLWQLAAPLAALAGLSGRGRELETLTRK